MTDLETQVAQAMADGYCGSPFPDGKACAGCAHVATSFAAQVAAAINKGIAVSAHIALTDATDFAPAWDAALAALRGTAPGETRP